ncbi:MAG: dihydroorotate dehydrogenase-like protein [Bacteroidales bacterium]|nr:dihydroorotate dehydrogenase-like protein [Bacteroidales bacterium]
MINLKTKYLGIELKNPIIVGASNLVTKVETLQQMEEAGAAAIVIKSLFEEQIQLENLQMGEEMDEYADRHAEVSSLFPTLEHAGPREHLMMVKQAKNAVKIPVIASLNAIYKETWLEYAKLLEDTGVDGIEMNFYAVPKDFNLTGEEIEKEQIEILKQVKSILSVPVSVKLSPFYASPLNVISRMDKTGVDGFVLFNRLFQPDIDLDNEEHVVHFPLSTPEDGKLSLRFAGLLYGNVKGSICSNTGIYTGADVARMLLAGADCVQVVRRLGDNFYQHVVQIGCCLCCNFNAL